MVATGRTTNAGPTIGTRSANGSRWYWCVRPLVADHCCNGTNGIGAVRRSVAQSFSSDSSELNDAADQLLMVARLHGPSAHSHPKVPMVRPIDCGQTVWHCTNVTNTVRRPVAQSPFTAGIDRTVPPTSDCNGRAEIAVGMLLTTGFHWWPTGLRTSVGIVCCIHHTAVQW